MPGSLSRILTRARASTMIDLVHIMGSARLLITESGARSSSIAFCHFISSLRATLDDAQGHDVPGPTIVVRAPISAFRTRSGSAASAFSASASRSNSPFTLACNGVRGLVVGAGEAGLEAGELTSASDDTQHSRPMR